MKAQHTQKIFILGCERSGSTWLTNILDSSPRIITYLEPFADYVNLIPSFPPRYCYLESVDESTLQSLNSRLNQLYELKYGGLYKPGKKHFLTHFDNFIARHFFHRRKIEFYELLNLNNASFIGKKSLDHIEVEVIKDLRLNFKVGILKQLYPNLKVLVAIRDPYLQVDSIMSWFEKGNLGELKRNLSYFFYYVQNHQRFSVFHKILEKSNLNDIKTALFFYWVVNYEILIEDLKKFEIDFNLIKNEDLINGGISVLERVLDHVDSPMVEYFNGSTAKNMQSKSPTDTFRNSVEYLIEKKKSVKKDSAILNAIKNEYEFESLAHYQ